MSDNTLAKPDDILVLKNVQTPPLKGQLGHIVEVLRGADGGHSTHQDYYIH